MILKFYKYQGTGNDFVMIDNRELTFPTNNVKLISQLCDRKFGIGADGLILLQNHTSLDFEMIYYNADGSTSTMCGNGGRCIVAFAQYLKLIDFETSFMASDGVHYATINDNLIALQMIDVNHVKVTNEYTYLYTGSPHHIVEDNNLEKTNVNQVGASIRYSELYGKEGCNINFVKQINENTFQIRTYERGVEAETLSCGTGATATAIAMYNNHKTISNCINILVQGGKLQIKFDNIHNVFKNVFLIGEAIQVFKGEINVNL
jgi:diaminopimelate epimerase